ncbi:MAG: selenium-binding family protein [Gemmatimonadales bacterium]|nr:selenium-binding family protein [Gemmatimonadales bacterium]
MAWLGGCARQAPAGATPSLAEYLYLWTASADSTAPDFLAVLDVTEASPRYGRLVTTLPVPGRGNVPHHTEHALPADRQLFANGFATGRTWVFDLREPTRPRIAAEFGEVAGLSHPHSFVRLPDGDVLATFQMRHDSAGMRTGGIAQLTSTGAVRRSRSGDFAGADAGLRAYSAAVVPALYRIVTTTSDMHADHPASRHLQLWRLSDFTLLATFPLPGDPEGLLTAEPRVLADGKRVLVSTFNCGLYLLEGLEGDAPSARLVASFPRKDGAYCAIPVVAGDYYLVTVPAWNAVVSLDVRDPAHPREVSRVTLGADDVPRWIALSGDRRRVVLTGYGALRHRVLLLRFDPATGALAVDERFREAGAAAPGFRLDDTAWPHGGRAAGIPHGAVFGQ